MKVRIKAYSFVLSFTLVELLVVIAIIFLLASLLLPTLVSAKARAKRVYCQNNLRQLALALEMYGEAYSRYPQGVRIMRNGGGGSTLSLWNAFLLEQLNSNRMVFNCPSYPAVYNWTQEPSELRFSFPTNIQGRRPFCYAMNVMGVSTFGAMGLTSFEAEVGRRPNEIRSPDNMIAFGDDTLSVPVEELPKRPGGGNQGVTKSNKVEGWGSFTFTFGRGATNRLPLLGSVHSQGANMTFVDGHVEWDRWWKWIEGNDAAARRWNFDNEPHGQFSSKLFHADSGLYYFGYRFYSPELQRWMNRDPIGEAGGINLFGYVANQPTMLIDPYGEAPSDVADAVDKAMSFGLGAGRVNCPSGILPVVDYVRSSGFSVISRIGWKMRVMSKSSTFELMSKHGQARST